jgi:hypothetical protein
MGVKIHHSRLYTAEIAFPRACDAHEPKVGQTPRSAADPLVGPSAVRILLRLGSCSGMAFYQRRLRRLYEHEIDQPVFVTLRLQDSVPSHRAFPTDALSSGQAFAARDRLPDDRAGAFYPRQPSRT